MTIPGTELYCNYKVMLNSNASNIQPVPKLCGLHGHPD